MPASGSLAEISTDLLSAYIEAVRPEVPDIYSKARQLSRMIGPMKTVQKINDKLYRIPLRKYVGGVSSKYDPAGGVLPFGSGQQLTHLTGGFISHAHAISVTREAEDKSSQTPGPNGGGSVLSYAKQFAEVMNTIATFEDVTLFQPGDGVLTSGVGASATSTSGSETSYTFATAGDYIGVKRLYEGLAVDVYNTGGTTKRANATRPGYPCVIDRIDFANRVVTLSNAVTGAATTDILAVAGMSATLAYGQSGWPLAGDSWRHGIPYWNETNTALYVLGKQRSTLPQLNPSSLAVNGSWTPFHTLFVMDQLRQRRSEDVLNGIVGICHMAQRTQTKAVGMAVTEIMTSPGTVQKSTDLMPSDVGMDDVFMFGTVRHIVTSRQPADRVDYINFSNWEKASVVELRPYPGGDRGPGIFTDRDATTGQAKASCTSVWDDCWDFVNVDPGAGAVLTGLTPYPSYN